MAPARPISPENSGLGVAAAESIDDDAKDSLTPASTTLAGDNKSAMTSTTRRAPAALLAHEEAEDAIVSFCQFLRFETVSLLSPASGAYRECASWLVERLRNVPVLSNNVCLLPEAPEHSPVVVAVWKGVDESLPVLLLNSHYDVVPADPNDWSVPPFEGLRREGRIYGRGAQDMKCVCMQYIEAIRKIQAMAPEWKPARSIYLTFVPHEEVGGDGMAAFLRSETYDSLPGIALALDEGLASTNDTFSVFYGERLPWWVTVRATGPTGHGSRFIENTAVEQLIDLANRALAFREGQRRELGLGKHENCSHAAARKSTLGDVTTLNITTLQAGVRVGDSYAHNCVPPTAECTLDIRITPRTPPSQIRNMLDEWCRECSKTNDGESKVTWSYAESSVGHEHATTSTKASENPWYRVFREAMEEDMGLKIDPQVFPAATDSRFLRALGIRALGFSPMRNTEIKLHEIDEYIPEATFLEGIEIYVRLIRALGSQGKEIEQDKLTS